MAGADVPSGRGGQPSPPSATSRRSTRSFSRLDLDEAVAWARRAAAGQRTPERERARADEERLRQAILEVRRARCVLRPEDAGREDLPYSQKRKKSGEKLREGLRKSQRIARRLSHLSSYLVPIGVRKRVGIHPTEYQASVPEWTGPPSEKDSADYNVDPATFKRLGTVVLPFNMNISAADVAKIGKTTVDDCNCSAPGSVACVRTHVKKARAQLKDHLGEIAFGNCGLDAMGEEVLKLWTAKDRKKLKNIENLIPENEYKKFPTVALKQFGSEHKRDLASYYYNVFLPRRLGSLNRAQPTNAAHVDTDDEDDIEYDESDDDNNEHHSEEKSKSSGSSSKRSRR